ncbi:MAG TPA: hypothetical protein VFA39_24110 [Steroidobacteraceae bacterium]|nr:hypothetical protein [Steroidobacteraceae bacterium]
MNHDSGYGASLEMGFPGDAVNPVARAHARLLVHWAKVAYGALAGHPNDRA